MRPTIKAGTVQCYNNIYNNKVASYYLQSLPLGIKEPIIIIEPGPAADQYGGPV